MDKIYENILKQIILVTINFYQNNFYFFILSICIQFFVIIRINNLRK